MTKACNKLGIFTLEYSKMHGFSLYFFSQRTILSHDQAENTIYLLGKIIPGSHKIALDISIPLLSGL